MSQAGPQPQPQPVAVQQAQQQVVFAASPPRGENDPNAGNSSTSPSAAPGAPLGALVVVGKVTPAGAASLIRNLF